ncbi:MAG TPA: imidazole glycerol phosphate synthase subunit HisF [Microscillaceae bacterium]|nr:imidazole glycerol phosphate synthase subunit HisF [Microscillaceae bacterium]
MTNNIRIIPRLDIKGPNLVKGIHLEGLRVLGKPEEFARYYYENGADELVYMDVVASLYERNSLHDIITKTAREIFIPLTVGGGLRTLDDITQVLRAGADKVSLNTAAIRNPEIITQASQKFGSSTIVIAIEAIKQNDGGYLAYTDNAREHTGLDVFEWAQRVEELGAGEIMITSVDQEGTGEGFDLELTQKIANLVSIPVIAHGGAGKREDVAKIATEGNVNAVALASILHYDYIKYLIEHPKNEQEGNTEFLKSGKAFTKIQSSSLPDIKKHLLDHHINCRPISHEITHR